MDFFRFCSSSAGSMATSLASQSSHLKNAFLYCMPVSLFPFLFFFRRRAVFVHLFLWVFFLYVGACCRGASTTSAAQCNQPCTKAAKQERADQSATTQASRVGDSQHVVEHLQSSLCSQNHRRNQICPA